MIVVAKLLPPFPYMMCAVGFILQYTLLSAGDAARKPDARTMNEKTIQLGELILTLDDIQVVLSDQIICKFRLSHRGAPGKALAELYGEVTDGELLVVCKTPLTARRFEILARFLRMYEVNIIKFLRDNTRGMTPYMFKVPMS